jgi:hypothetical protein
MNIEQRLQAARHRIAGYIARIAEFESGAAVPQVGELIGTHRLLKRAQRKLRTLEVTRMALPQNIRVAHCRAGYVFQSGR